MHTSVLLTETTTLLRPNREEGTLLDATVGLGGHAEALLEHYPRTHLLGIDRDPAALERAAARLGKFGSRVTLVRGRHEKLIEILKQSQIEAIGGRRAALGVPSRRPAAAARGFPSRHDAPLDMRRGPASRSAAELVNPLDGAGLATILRDHGEEPQAGRIA